MVGRFGSFVAAHGFAVNLFAVAALAAIGTALLSLGAGGALWLTLSDGRAETISGPGGTCRRLPALPPGAAGLAPGSSRQVDVLAADGTKLTDWRLDSRGAAWDMAQMINVPIQYGSSS